MPLPETIERTYLPGDNIDATTVNIVQHGITANRARIEQLAAPQLHWLVGRTVGDVTFDDDGMATIDGTARVFIDCRLGKLHEVLVHCRADGDGIEFNLVSGNVVLASKSHTGNGTKWVSILVGGFLVTQDTKLSLTVVTEQPQSLWGLCLRQ